ncbi:MAG: PIN domain-containing protein [Pseudomonadota bacterium]
MFADASAIVAILNDEPGGSDLLHRIGTCRGDLFVSPLVRFETTAALARSRSGGRRPTPEQFAQAEAVTNAFCDRIGAEDISITRAIGDKALAAGRTYGKFVGHPADLNFGDCYAHACATAQGVPLLYRGTTFRRPISREAARWTSSALPPARSTTAGGPPAPRNPGRSSTGGRPSQSKSSTLRGSGPGSDMELTIQDA